MNSRVGAVQTASMAVAAHVAAPASDAGSGLELSDLAHVKAPTGDRALHGRLGTHVSRDVSGRDIGASALQLASGPQHASTETVTVGGEREHFQPHFVHAEPIIDEYSFGVRISF